MIGIAALVVGIVLGLVFHPSVPEVIQPYLPIAVVAALYYLTDISRVLLFWVAFILTRPLGATVGDLLDKPHASGGLALSRVYASAVLIVSMLALIVLLPQRPGRHPANG